MEVIWEVISSPLLGTVRCCERRSSMNATILLHSAMRYIIDIVNASLAQMTTEQSNETKEDEDEAENKSIETD